MSTFGICNDLPEISCCFIHRFSHPGGCTQTITLYPEDWIELAPEVFEGDDRSELHQFFLTELLPELREEPICDPAVCVCHSLCQSEREALP